jgi:hypothetical protein
MEYLLNQAWNNYSGFEGARNIRKKPYSEKFLQYQDKVGGKRVGMFLYVRKELPPSITKADLVSQMKELFVPILNCTSDLQSKIDENHYDD